ncbi:Carbon monoxide dehydrogenase medium chain [subsurface metagenome]
MGDMRFNYLEPASIEEAVSLLGKYDGKVRVIAGGTDLMVQMKDRALKPEHVVDIEYIPGLDFINYGDTEGLRIGALTTIRTLEKSAVLQERYPVISQAAGLLGSVAIRNVATIGGNLCNAAPSADTAPALIGLSAKAKIIGKDGERVVPFEEFFIGPGETVLKRGELLAEVQVPVPLPDTRGVYLKHSRSSIDLATVGVVVIMTLGSGGLCQEVKVVLGAVAPTPIRAKRAEVLLKGTNITPPLIKEAAQAASEEAQPITDVRASAEYRREMVKLLTRRVIEQLVAG